MQTQVALDIGLLPNPTGKTPKSCTVYTGTALPLVALPVTYHKVLKCIQSTSSAQLWCIEVLSQVINLS